MPSIQVAQNDVAEVILGPVSPGDISLTIDVLFLDPTGQETRVPAFVNSGKWRARYSSALVGAHQYRAKPSDGTILSRPAGKVEVTAQRDSGSLRSHGPLRVAKNGRYLEHLDGTPFLWLADTWWHGFTKRLHIDEFRQLSAQRAEQGFSVIQIVAGLYPEMEPFSPEGCSYSGWVWHDDFTEPNTAWFEEADQRIIELVEHDLIPCIVGSWSLYIEHMTVHQMLRHWRELIARWGAYPVVWCLIGEPPAPWGKDNSMYKLIDSRVEQIESNDECRRWVDELLGEDTAKLDISTIKTKTHFQLEKHTNQSLEWLNDVATGVRHIEPFGRPITIHSQPRNSPWASLKNELLVDFWLQQTGHCGLNRLEEAVNSINTTIDHLPSKPVINGEACYEGISDSNWHDTQRFLFWTHMLSGTAGHSYGAHGVWAFNTKQFPGFQSGRAPLWRDAANFSGARHVGIGRHLLQELPWHEFRPHPEWLETHNHVDDRYRPYAAGIVDGKRIIYIPSLSLVKTPYQIRLRALGSKNWHAQAVDPRTGKPEPSFVIYPECDGTMFVKRGHVDDPLPSWDDWLLFLAPE